uniref:Peptidase S1 domain-containing protein n=1 Tax=Macrostomum lignano TaxID=282301 RepID=A0A1I8GRS9_9PLAT
PAGCGRPDTQPDIRGAAAPNVIAEAAPHSWPWVASLQLRGHHRCSGTILSSDWVLTSARCADLSPTPADWRVDAGRHCRDCPPEQGEAGSLLQRRRVARIARHPGYNSSSGRGDLALLRLGWPLEFGGSRVAPACLSAGSVDADAQLDGAACFATAWGDLSSSGVGDSPRLQQVLLPIVPNWLCSDQLQHGDVVTDASICAGWGQAGSPRCQGDGGQPLVCWRPALRLWQLLGVNSWTDLCARSPRPGLFTRVSAHLDWIRRQAMRLSKFLLFCFAVAATVGLLLQLLGRQHAAVLIRPKAKVMPESDSAAAKADLAVTDSTPSLPKRSREAAPHSWPWMASLRDSSDRHHCGGSVITERWVLTAAHCFNESEDPTMWSVDAGRHCHNCSEPAVQRRALAEVVIHPAYNASTLEADLALLLLESPLDFSGSAVALATLAASAAPEDSVCIVTGWGLPRMDAAEAEQPINLQEVAVPIVPASVCSDEDHYGDAVDAGSVLCAGYELGGGDACKGYSGGPLVCRDGGASWLLHGVTSWGDGCALPRKPTVYIRVEAFIDWIRQTVSG